MPFLHSFEFKLVLSESQKLAKVLRCHAEVEHEIVDLYCSDLTNKPLTSLGCSVAVGSTQRPKGLIAAVSKGSGALDFSSRLIITLHIHCLRSV